MATEEKTFRAYTQQQGENYAANRTGYPPELFKVIIDHHTSTGGQLDTVVDLGCGPGQAARGLAPHFNTTIGLDPSQGMIDTARRLEASTTDPKLSPIRFEVSTAEALGSDLEPPIADGSVDLITAATAAHWFDMTRFWPRAARALKPGGTVAFWAATGLFIHPWKTPNAAAIQTAMEDARRGEDIQAYRMPGNEITRNLYVDLPLPWTIGTRVEEFDKDSFFRKEWNKGGHCAEGEDFFATERTLTTEALEKYMGTASTITRWREAHPEKVGTEEDVARKMRRRIESLLHDAGVKPGEEKVTGGAAIVLLMIKKKAE